MQKSSFIKGMSKLRRKGFSKRDAFNRMSALAWSNRLNSRMGNTKRSRYLASKNLSRISSVRN